MLLRPIKLVFLLVLIPCNARAMAEPEVQTASHSRCSIYLAPSTIEGAGLGVFTTKSIARGAKIGVPDVIVPIIDLRVHHPNIYCMLQDYVWDGLTMMGMHREGDNEHLEAFAPGIDCLVNCHLGLLNLDRNFPIYDTTLPHRDKYPSAGSMTAYWNNSSSYAIEDVPAGAELFKHYGDGWFTSRNHIFVNIPFANHYRDAADLVKKIKELLHETLSLSEEAQHDLYDIMLSPQSAILNALPRHVHQIDMAVNEGIRSVLQLNHVRDNLHEMPDARCFESIVPGQSTIEGAGRGGFAAWSFQKGHIITGSPLMHIVDKKGLEMYDLSNHGDGSTLDPPEVVAHQLLLNYCWGHPKTDLILCPNGAGVNLLNHSRERANVKIQWAPDGQLSHDDSWLSTSVKYMSTTYQPHLGWDYVALRDIEEGEELFIDYGDEWVTAWEDHVEEWQNAERPSEYAEYMSAAEWNELYAEADIRTVREQRKSPYPDNIEVVCHPSVNANAYEERQLEGSMWNLWTIAEDGVPCKVTARTSTAAGKTFYTVKMDAGKSVLVRKKVMREMLRFRDAEYSTDMHLDGVFRKEATIPNDMLPMAWRRQEVRAEHDEL